MDMRRRYPFMGKARIQCMLRSDGLTLSVSTVGRILSRALATGEVRHASFCEGRLKPKRRRAFSRWARRWKYGSKARKPGELVQVDHMTYARDGQAVKEFRAVCPVTKFMATRVYSRATAGNAARFLADLAEALPFPLRLVAHRHLARAAALGVDPFRWIRSPRSACAGRNLIASSRRSLNAASRRRAIATCGSLTSATTCLRLSPVARSPLKPSSCNLSAICASA